VVTVGNHRRTIAPMPPNRAVRWDDGDGWIRPRKCDNLSVALAQQIRQAMDSKNHNSFWRIK